MARRVVRYVGTLGLTLMLAGSLQRAPIHEPAVPEPGEAPGLGHSNVATRVGALEGFVRLAGDTIPERTRVANTTDPGICGEVQSLDDLLLSEHTRGIQGVVVTFPDLPASTASSGPQRLVLDNRDCRFEPHVSVLTTGSTIVAANHDPLLHTVHYYGALRGNLSLPRKGIRRSQIVEEPGMIVVKCDVHGWMQAFIRVDTHPFHAATGPEGAFRIPNIPEGEHTVELWHERLGTQRTTVRIEAGETTTLDAEYILGTAR